MKWMSEINLVSSFVYLFVERYKAYFPALVEGWLWFTEMDESCD